MNKYELIKEGIDEVYNYMFSDRKQFVHKANPDGVDKLTHIENVIERDTDHLHALALYKAAITYYEDAYNSIDNYCIYDNEQERNKDYERILEDQTE